MDLTWKQSAVEAFLSPFVFAGLIWTSHGTAAYWRFQPVTGTTIPKEGARQSSD